MSNPTQSKEEQPGNDQALPAIPSDITPEWLSSKLGHDIKSIQHTRSIWGTGSKLFYTLTYSDPTPTTSKPTHICIKGVFDPSMIQAQPWTVSLAQREADFFSKIAPTLNGPTSITFPRGYWSGTSDTQGISVMEDLSEAGCTFAPEVASYPVAIVLDAVSQLAALHARYWGQSQEDHPWIWNNYDPAMKFMCSPPSNWESIVRQPDRPPLPEYLMDGTRLNLALDRYFAERNPRFRTLLHGDTHIGNVYFTPNGKRIGFLDWSAFHFGSCFHDIVYHVTAMLTVQDRRAHEMEILDHYLEVLHKLGGPRFDRHEDGDVMVEYRRSFMTNVIWLICPDGLQSKERVAELCRRTVAAWGDHAVVDLILGEEEGKRDGEGGI